MMRGAARSEGWLPAEEGLRLHYQLCGSGSQAVVVPLAVYLAGPLGPLADGQRLIFYDLRGRGRSDAVRDPARIGITHDLTDVEAVRRHFGLERMALVGFSYVGAIAAVYAAEHPDRVSRLIALGAMAPSAALGRSYNPPEKALRVRTPAAQEVARLLQSGASKRDPDGFCRRFWRANAPVYVGDPALADRFPVDFCDLPNERPEQLFAWYGHVDRSLGEWDFRDQAGSITAEALVMHGDRDLIAPPEGARVWAERMPNARLMMFPGAGHALYVEQPEPVLAAMRRFLDGEWPTGAIAVPASPQP